MRMVFCASSSQGERLSLNNNKVRLGTIQ